MWMYFLTCTYTFLADKVQHSMERTFPKGSDLFQQNNTLCTLQNLLKNGLKAKITGLRWWPGFQILQISIQLSFCGMCQRDQSIHGVPTLQLTGLGDKIPQCACRGHGLLVGWSIVFPHNKCCLFSLCIKWCYGNIFTYCRCLNSIVFLCSATVLVLMVICTCWVPVQYR